MAHLTRIYSQTKCVLFGSVHARQIVIACTVTKALFGLIRMCVGCHRNYCDFSCGATRVKSDWIGLEERQGSTDLKSYISNRFTIRNPVEWEESQGQMRSRFGDYHVERNNTQSESVQTENTTSSKLFSFFPCKNFCRKQAKHYYRHFILPVVHRVCLH